MSSYASLAAWYDLLTGDVPYGAFADFYEAEFARCGGEFRLLLDFCCGTGTLTAEMARRGYEMIGSDASVEMLMQARDKCASLPVMPLFLNQRAEELDLYGTVDAAYCSLDGMNYLPPEALPELFRRLHLFVRPGGLVIFDVKTPEWFRSLDGQIFLDEKEDVFCVWRADYLAEKRCLVYGMDLFERAGRLWRRSGEEHVEYAHEPEALCALLEQAGFGSVIRHEDGPQHDQGRLFISAARGG
ncbi:MAG: class I SAM-dependent methyltransferase [Oscillospiraceae bacterium]|nr:class I SAM-dependent methyltransferase [Oscillospiraceae bacterium]